MKINYRFNPLSRDEREFLEMVLLEELEIQSWYAITYSTVLSEEVFLAVQ